MRGREIIGGGVKNNTWEGSRQEKPSMKQMLKKEKRNNITLQSAQKQYTEYKSMTRTKSTI